MDLGRSPSQGVILPTDEVYVLALFLLKILALLTDRWLVLGLQVLDNVIMTRWKILPRDHATGELDPVEA
jgi:hypothetical protein